MIGTRITINKQSRKVGDQLIKGTILPNPENKTEELIIEACKLLADTLIKKNRDYQDSYFKSVEKYGDASVLVRLSDKFNRFEHLMLSENKVVNVDEKEEETLLDLAGYSVLEYVRRHKG